MLHELHILAIYNALYCPTVLVRSVMRTHLISTLNLNGLIADAIGDDRPVTVSDTSLALTIHPKWGKT